MQIKIQIQPRKELSDDKEGIIVGVVRPIMTHSFNWQLCVRFYFWKFEKLN